MICAVRSSKMVVRVLHRELELCDWQSSELDVTVPVMKSVLVVLNR